MGALRSHWSKMDKLAQFTSVRNFFGKPITQQPKHFDGILSNACQDLQKSFVTFLFIYLFIYIFIYLLREGIGG